MDQHRAMLHLIGRSFNGYRVVRLIARGGMGVVFEGFQESLGRPVALKFLYPHLSGDERFRERFEREARAVGQLNHPNIVRVLDYGVEETYYYMVLDYLAGTSLRDRLESVHSQGLTLRTDRLLEIVRQVGGALAYAHRLGFVHRDVKPGNIILSDSGHAYLTDFGVVKMVGSQQSGQITATGSYIGTPEYMAPEQVAGGDTGPAADQYALAIVAYEMLVGRVPFQATTHIAVMQKQLNEPPPPPSSLLPWLAHEIDTTFARALAKHPDARHSSMNELVNDLVRVLSNPRSSAGADMPVGLADPPTGRGPGTPSSSGGVPISGTTAPTMAFSPHPGTTPASGATPPGPSQATPPPSHPGIAASGAGASGTVPPPGPPGAVPQPISGAIPPEQRRSTVVIGGLLALLLVLGVGGFLLFRDDGEDEDGRLSGGDAAATATSSALALGTGTATATTTATESAGEATATSGAGGVDTPTAEPLPPTATATATPLPAMVIYYAYKLPDEDNPQIYVMDLDGSDERLFAEARGHSWAPRVSPDGSHLFFSSVTREGHSIHTADGGGLVGSGDHDIYVLDIQGGDLASLAPANLTNVTDALPSWDNGWSWTVDGAWITLTSDRPDSAGSTDWEIYLMKPDGSEVRQLTDTPHNEGWPVWTPDGSQIVYASNETGDSEIYIMDADGTNPRRLTDRSGTNDLYPSVSPDGTKIVFSSQIPDGNEGNIWIMDLDGGNLEQLTNTAALNNIPSWCPAGDLIVFVSDIRGYDNVYSMNADGSGVERLTEGPQAVGEDRPENTTPDCAFLPGGLP